MDADNSVDIDIISATLLRVAERVAEVSHDHVVNRVWSRRNASVKLFADCIPGRKIVEAGGDRISAFCDEQVSIAFATGEDVYAEYSVEDDSASVTYGIRILHCHPDNNFVFATIENLPSRGVKELAEDKWKLALDAAGDGLFDTDLVARKVFFSQKWREIFGYSESDISTMDEWSAKIHPDDLPGAVKQFERYLAGELPSYSQEMRYRCKDGTYKWVLSRGVIISRTKDGKPLRYTGTHTDINERKTSEERYKAMTHLLSKLINNLQESILVIDENWKVVFVNQLYSDLYAKRGNPEELIGKDMRENLATRKYSYKDPEGFYKRTIEIFEKKEIVLEDDLESVDGKIISRDYIPLSLDNNSKGGIWKFRDVTEQRNVEKRFEMQRLFYERILNNISIDLAVYNSERRYLYVNPIAVADNELRQWLIGKTDEEYCIHKNRPIGIAERRKEIFYAAVEEKQLIEWEEKTENRSGAIEYHMRRMFPVFDKNGKLDIMIGYGMDITDRVNARQAMKTSIDTFSSAFDHSGIGMAILGLDGKWMDVNKALCDLTGYTKEELLQLNYHQITYPEDDEMDRPLINKLLNMEIPTYTIEKRYVSKANKIILVSLTVSLVWNHDETPKFFIAQVIDITERHALENDIRRKNMELEATRISLVNKITQLEELSHIIAHNLRGPAGNVKMFSEILLARQNNVTEAENPLVNAFTTEEIGNFIHESSVSLMDSLSTLMEIAEIKLNKKIPYNDCDIPTVIHGIITQLQGVIHEKNAAIIQRLEVNTVSYPKAYLENILYNFISNALKYSFAGKHPEIIISSRVLKNKKTQLIVKDNGIGIDMQKFGDKVFKLNQVFHEGYDSKGVGLYITKTQVESLGGSIELKSKPNEGCEFTVTL